MHMKLVPVYESACHHKVVCYLEVPAQADVFWSAGSPGWFVGEEAPTAWQIIRGKWTFLAYRLRAAFWRASPVFA